MENSIVGREKEKAQLKEYMLSERSEFIAIYGKGLCSATTTFSMPGTILVQNALRRTSKALRHDT